METTIDLHAVKRSAIINSKGIKYSDFRGTLAPNFTLVWVHILLGHSALLATVVLGYQLQKMGVTWLINIPLMAISIGYFIAYLHLFMHEAAHFNIAASKQKNDQLANIFIGLFIGLDIKFYRFIHFEHHKHHGTIHDTEKTYFDALNWRFVLETLTGVRVLRVLTNRSNNVKNQATPDQEIEQSRRRWFWTGAVFSLVLVICLFFLVSWQAALAWMGGVGVLFPFFAAIRQVLEHRDEHADASVDYNEVPHGATHRMFGEGILASTFGAAGFNRHYLHHWDPQISYTRLHDVEAFLNDTALAQDVKEHHTSYWATFKTLFNH